MAEGKSASISENNKWSIKKRFLDGTYKLGYVPDHHEAIISHEDFEAAATLIEQRASEKGIKKGNAKYQQRYAFSSKIICGECGNTFRRRIHSSTYGKYAAWVCNTHLEDTSRCSMVNNS